MSLFGNIVGIVAIVVITLFGAAIVHDVNINKELCTSLNGTLLISPTFDDYKKEQYCMLNNGGIVDLNQVNLTAI